MINKRMRQLILMLSEISGRTLSECESIIRKTETGKAILGGNEMVLYEQQTENLYCIAQELREIREYEDVAGLLSVENIVCSMQKLQELEWKDMQNREQICLVYPKVGTAVRNKQELVRKHREKLQLQNQNKRNIRRINNVNKLEG